VYRRNKLFRMEQFCLLEYMYSESQRKFRRNMLPPSSGLKSTPNKNRELLSASWRLLACLTLQSSRLWRHVSLKCRLTFTRLHSLTFQKIGLRNRKPYNYIVGSMCSLMLKQKASLRESYKYSDGVRPLSSQVGEFHYDVIN
jgi:hypothetical protein